MKLLFDFFPIVIFFIIFKFYGIYVATASFIIASFLQVSIHYIRFRKFEKMHLLTFILGVLLGGATLFFHNEMFIKWKPTAIYWALAIFFVASQFFGDKNLLQSMMEQSIQAPKEIWKKLNYVWSIFFTAMGFINLYVVYHYDTNIWVNFKLFGILGLTIIFVILQGVYLSRHIKSDEASESNENS